MGKGRIIKKGSENSQRRERAKMIAKKYFLTEEELRRIKRLVALIPLADQLLKDPGLDAYLAKKVGKKFNSRLTRGVPAG